MLDNKIDIVGLHENAYLDNFICAWAHDYLGLNSKMKVIRDVSMLVKIDGEYGNTDFIREVIASINKKILSETSNNHTIPLAIRYSYARTDSATARFFGIDPRSIRRLKNKIRDHIKSILKSKGNLNFNYK